MLKNALFFGKSWKNRRSVGDSALNPPWSPAARVPPPRSISSYSQSPYVLLLSTAHADFSASLKYDLLSHTWAIVSGPLSQACPPGWNLKLRHCLRPCIKRSKKAVSFFNHWKKMQKIWKNWVFVPSFQRWKRFNLLFYSGRLCFLPRFLSKFLFNYLTGIFSVI